MVLVEESLGHSLLMRLCQLMEENFLAISVGAIHNNMQAENLQVGRV